MVVIHPNEFLNFGLFTTTIFGARDIYEGNANLIVLI